MKIKFLTAGLLMIASASAFAQKGEVSNASAEYTKYEGLKSVQAALAKTSLTNAKTSIDKAAANEKTSALPQTYALKAAIYSAYAVNDTVTSTSTPLYTTAQEAFTKAKQLDTKNENKGLLESAAINLGNYLVLKGSSEYQHKNYEGAYKSFDAANAYRPGDTTVYLNGAISALNAKNYPATIQGYSKLLTTKYSGNEQIYHDLAQLYMYQKDTTNALKTVNEGVAKYPASNNLRTQEIEINIQSGKSKEVQDKIQAALTKDPKNKTLYYYSGVVYGQTADAIGQKAAKTKDAAAKAALMTTKNENITKAAEMYKKALEIDPNYFDANLNMGYVLLAPAIDKYNAANQTPANKQKEYEAALAKAGLLFDAAKPYIFKSLELQPKNPDVINNVITYYKGKKDDANVAKYNKILGDIK